jgi:hypothetical protein
MCTVGLQLHVGRQAQTHVVEGCVYYTNTIHTRVSTAVLYMSYYRELYVLHIIIYILVRVHFSISFSTTTALVPMLHLSFQATPHTQTQNQSMPRHHT